MRKVILLPEQSLFDITIQEYGILDKVFDLAQDNGVSITAKCKIGTVLQCSTDSKSPIVNYLAAKNIKPVSNTSLISRTRGIGYMQIGIDFIIS